MGALPRGPASPASDASQGQLPLAITSKPIIVLQLENGCSASVQRRRGQCGKGEDLCDMDTQNKPRRQDRPTGTANHRHTQTRGQTCAGTETHKNTERDLTNKHQENMQNTSTEKHTQEIDPRVGETGTFSHFHSWCYFHWICFPTFALWKMT